MSIASLPPPDDGIVLLRGEGDFDIVTSDQLGADLTQTLQAAPAARALILDLTGVAFFDSSALRMVDGFARQCSALGTWLRVVARPGSAARRVLDLVGILPDLLDDDVDSAVARAAAAF